MMMMLLWSAVYTPLGSVSARVACVRCRGNISGGWRRWNLGAKGREANRPRCLHGAVNNELVVLRD